MLSLPAQTTDLQGSDVVSWFCLDYFLKRFKRLALEGAAAEESHSKSRGRSANEVLPGSIGVHPYC
jgi:hypothetical protein